MNRSHIIATIAALATFILLDAAGAPAPAPPDNARDEQRSRDPDKRGRGKDGRKRGERGSKGRRGGGPPASFRTEVPRHPRDIILCRPTVESVTLSVLSYTNTESYIAYGTEKDRLLRRTPTRTFTNGQPADVTIDSLRPDTRYYYRFHSRPSTSAPWETSEEYTFHTARSPGRGFTFTITADSHLDDHTEPDLYRITLANALADAPDFHVDLGDTFMTDKYPRHQDALPQYLAQRYYFGLIAHSAPLFLVLGNHDGEAGRWLDGTDDNMAIWSNTRRKRYFPNPMPDSFYSGNPTEDPFAGFLQNYYAWEWGDALFIVLDPFRFCPRQRGAGDNWTRTLGREQYDWLTRTLERSQAKFRLVFIHNLVGGLNKEGRGGSEAAPLFEWGGKDPDGTDVFRKKRPGWPMPIHQLLDENRVNAVFHGHDHLYAKQDLDGIVYQEVPQPGHPRARAQSAEEYGYVSGEIQGGSGHMRVTVSSRETTVEYVRAALPGDRRVQHPNRAVSHRYALKPR